MTHSTIGGGPATGTVRTFPDRSPVTGEVVAEIPAFSVEESLEAVEAAAAAQTEWAARPYTDRRNILLKAAEVLEAGLDEYAETMALEVGATRAWAQMNVHESASTLREAAGLTSTPVGELLPSFDSATVNHSLRRPAGVSLSIVPWNAPVILAARSSAISLAVGNAVIIRPSEEAPLSAGGILSGALVKAGVPADVVPVVTSAPGEGRRLIDAMIGSPLVRRVAFIGSTPVGRAIAARAGTALTPAVLELGGKNITIVREDADLEAWAPAIAFSAFANTGQVWMCTDTLLVHRSRYDETLERLAAIADAMVVGDPRSAETDLGPLINTKAAEHFSELVDDATAQGSRVVAGGTRDGRFARPTVLADVSDACRYYAEEGFAPIISVTPFDDDDEAAARANQGDFGLIGAVISADRDAAYRLALRVRAGAIHVNGPSVGDEPHVPFGGLGASGMGRLGGMESVRFFTEQRSLYVH
ncbi:aldehyde dehydrogenase family protein [Arthrobacter sp. SD76]|uniref:aldehyde dehydrogenase family protein n=1 Tax=Arthrobacter sp. SD76 TaxID=3415007 RepID=UPI003C772865